MVFQIIIIFEILNNCYSIFDVFYVISHQKAVISPQNAVISNKKYLFCLFLGCKEFLFVTLFLFFIPKSTLKFQKHCSGAKTNVVLETFYVLMEGKIKIKANKSGFCFMFCVLNNCYSTKVAFSNNCYSKHQIFGFRRITVIRIPPE